MMNTYATCCLYDHSISGTRRKNKYTWNRYKEFKQLLLLHVVVKSQNLCKHVHKNKKIKNKHNIEYFNLFISKCMNEKKNNNKD